jgi:hypothetical protein
VYNTTPGSGCPAGANVLQTYSLSTALSSAFGSNKRVLFRCGDTFTGNYSFATGLNKASIGAYGGCENTTSGRPIFQNSNGNTISLNNADNTPTDVRITDIDFEDSAFTGEAIGSVSGAGQKQVTIYNVKSASKKGIMLSDATESGVIDSYSATSYTDGGVDGYPLYFNYYGNHCLNGSNATYCGLGSYNPANYYNVAYNAIIGNYLSKLGATMSGPETLRIGASRYIVVSNNSLVGSSPNWGATMKMISGNPTSTWLGQYQEYSEVSDNYFTGPSGGNLVEINATDTHNDTDERHRYLVFERNLLAPSTQPNVGFTSYGANITVRNNVLYAAGGSMSYGFQLQRQDNVTPGVTGVEEYNNTCYAKVTMSSCLLLDTSITSSFSQNNLFYNNGSATGAVVNNLGGASNTVANNTTSSATNPLLINASGSFSRISDFQPTQNYSGGAEVPVWYDGMGVAWSPTWNLGALKP